MKDNPNTLAQLRKGMADHRKRSLPEGAKLIGHLEESNDEVYEWEQYGTPGIIIRRVLIPLAIYNKQVRKAARSYPTMAMGICATHCWHHTWTLVRRKAA